MTGHSLSGTSVPGLGPPEDWESFLLGRGLPESVVALVAARVGGWTGPDGPPGVQTAALSLLRAAVERGEAVGERRAVACLEALGESYPRLRWTTVAPEDRLITTAVTDSPVTALGPCTGREASDPGFTVGTASGCVESWEGDALRRVGRLRGPVHAVAGHGREVLAGGPDGGWELFGSRAHRGTVRGGTNAAVTAVALRADGWMALGTETGAVQVGPGPERLEDIGGARDTRVRLLAWLADGTLDAQWADGGARFRMAGESQPGPARDDPRAAPVTMKASAPPPRPWADHAHEYIDTVAGRAGRLAEAWSDGMLVIWGTDGSARLVQRSGVRAMALSDEGRLAVCGADGRLEVRDPSHDGALQILPADASAVVFLDEERLACAEQREITLWDTDPTRWGLETAREPDDRITAVAVAADAPHRVAVGTIGGGLRLYEGRGRVRERGFCTPGKVHQLVAKPGSAGQTWLAATDTGFYEWRLGHSPEPQAAGACTAVGAVPDAPPVYALGSAVCAGDKVVRELWRHPSPVTSVAVSARHGIAALDYSGALTFGTHRGRRRTYPAFLPGHTVLGWAPEGSLFCLSGTDDTGYVSVVRVTPDGEVEPAVAGMPAGTRAAVGEDGTLVTIHPVHGLQMMEPAGGVRARWPVTGRVVGLGEGHVLVGTDTELEVYDVMPAASSSDTSGEVMVRVAQDDDHRCLLRWDLPARRGITLGAVPSRPDPRDDGLGRLWHDADSQDVQVLAEAADRAERLGEQVWAAGLAAAVDRARGPDPDRQVRLRWDIPDVKALHAVPWELLHDRDTGLLCFQEPPITTVRSVARLSTAQPLPPHAAHGRQLLMYRIGSDRALTAVRTDMVRLGRRLAPKGIGVKEAPGPDPGGLPPCDILHIWAHCGETGIELGTGTNTNTDLEQFVGWVRAGGPPRLVVLVGCESTRAARLLIEAGVETVVAMRRTVMTGMVSVLVEDFTRAHADGLPPDRAFAQGLGAYIRTGHPGGAAVPVIYLRSRSES
ncbi:hypothetical protein JS756_31230 [Streptomyces actuosus]|uniref:CHAT domain-containing protein n=1 Tax=Streptomyces actuosus TaxID=1885 RepID=A0ABS2VZN5_STRAS|nr:hypothetical protein [Streptomyces actuosus]MBN0048494.1 hypothetical protein [Streptomyces actuosus]